MRATSILLAVATTCAASASWAEPSATTLDGQVLAEDGRAAAFTAVLLDEVGPEKSAPKEIHLDEVWLSFVPKVQVVAPGSTLVLSNHDDDSHTVHARFRGQTLFDVATVPNETTRKVKLPEEGLVTITCDMHREMRAYVIVDKARYAAVSGADGRFHFSGLRPGSYRIRLWRPSGEEPVEHKGITLSSIELPRKEPLTLRLKAEPSH
jgi:plastocyanin